MKKLLSLVVALALVLALGVSISAESAIDRLPSETDTRYEIAPATEEIVVDGALDEGQYTPLYYIRGEDVIAVTSQLGGTEVYRWFMVGGTACDRYIVNGNYYEDVLEYMADSYTKGYASWSGNYLYFFIEMYYGDMPYYGADPTLPAPDHWKGTCAQIAFDRIDVDYGTKFDWAKKYSDVEVYVAEELGFGGYYMLCESSGYDKNPYGITSKDIKVESFNNGKSIAYEVQIDVSKMDLATCNNEIFLSIAHNFNTADSFNELDWFGYQFGEGALTTGKDIKRYPEEEGHAYLTGSVTLVLSGESSQPVHTHKAGDEWKTDGENHWKACSCGEIMEKATHTGGEATWEKKAVCEVCGVEYGELAEKPHEHAAEGEWKTDGENHWKVCSCGEIMEKGDHKGGTATTEKKAVCSTCGAEYGELAEPDHVHAAEDEWKSDGENHWKSCSCGEVMETAAHTGGTATTEAKAKCEVCGAEYGELAQPDHVHAAEGEWQTDGENHWKACSCGEVMETGAHTGGEATTDAKAKCEVCGAEYGELAVDPDPVDEPDPEFPVVPVVIGAVVLVAAIIVVAVVLSKKKK